MRAAPPGQVRGERGLASETGEPGRPDQEGGARRVGEAEEGALVGGPSGTEGGDVARADGVRV